MNSRPSDSALVPHERHDWHSYVTIEAARSYRRNSPANRRTQYERRTQRSGGTSRICGALNEVTVREVEVEILRHDKEALEFDVTRCRFAESFRALGEPVLGDREGEVSLDRAQTIMQGAPSCTFRYKFAPR
jgi:hypothetical protein